MLCCVVLCCVVLCCVVLCCVVLCCNPVLVEFYLDSDNMHKSITSFYIFISVYL